jgi:tight adherence protein C
MIESLLFFFAVTGFVGCLCFVVSAPLLNRDDKRISERLNDRGRRDEGSGSVRRDGRNNGKTETNPLKRLALAVAAPFLPSNTQKISGVRAKLAMAGIYDPAMSKTLAGYKLISLLLGLLVGFFVGSVWGFGVMGMALGGLIGYLAPQLWLSSKIGANQKSLNVGLPDALDLMVICVESGLTIDSTLSRVGDELAMTHPAVAREFGITHTETRLGVSRQDAFKNMATRTGNVALQALTAMLIQADRFGTSIGHALRIQAESLRQKRQYAAEELAAKASVKMSFPLVLFVFPATFIVLAGPTVIGLLNSALFQE